ncbi:MAG: class I SAM-dependent methyltransferase [Leptospirales bacterium]
MNPARCPACLSPNSSFSGTIDRFTPPFEVVQCAECGSFYRHPQPSDESAYYDENYYTQKSDFSYMDERKIFAGSKHVWNARLKQIRKYHPTGKFLDVGCSFGGFTFTAAQYFDAWGIDVSKYAIKEASAFLQKIAKDDDSKNSVKGLFQTELTTLPEKKLPENQFSVITMIEVLEHLKNPREHIAKAHKLLQPGGLLVIQTANMDGRQAVQAGLQYHYFLPGHLTCFTARGLKQMLRELGFTTFREFIPVDFGLMPKLKKMQTSFTSPLDYIKWFRTTWYHLTSYLRYKGQPLTSSYVLYAFKR